MRPAFAILVVGLLPWTITRSPVQAEEPECLFETCPGTWRDYTVVVTGAITSIASAPDGRLFFGMEAGGVRVYRPDSQGEYRWSGYTTSNSGLASNAVTDLALFGGELWVGTNGAGISRLDLSTGAWTTVNVANSPLPSDTIRKITAVPPPPWLEDPTPQDASVWVATELGAANYTWVTVGGKSFWRWIVKDATNDLPESDVRAVAVQFHGTARHTWFATYSQLTLHDGDQYIDMTGSGGMYTADCMAADPSGNMWFNRLWKVPLIVPEGDGTGAAESYKPIGVCRRYFNPLLQKWEWESRNDIYAHDMSVDSSGRLWMGSHDEQAVASGGAWSHDQAHWCVFLPPGTPISSTDVQAVHALDEATWFGHLGTPTADRYSSNWRSHGVTEMGSTAGTQAGAILLTSDTAFVGIGSLLSWRPLEGDEPWEHVTVGGNAPITCLLHDGTDLWAGKDGGGVRRLSPSGNLLESWDMSNGFPSNHVRALARDKQGRLWAATSAGLALRANEYWLTFTAENSPLRENDLRALTVDSRGRLWIGTASQGISTLEPEASGDGAWGAATTAGGLPSNAISALATSQDGRVWAGTDAGIAVWSPRILMWAIHDAASGDLPDDEVLCIASSAGGLTRGRVWVGTAGGLALREGSTWRHFHVTGSTLTTDRVRAVAANGMEMWAASGSTVAVRRNILGPLGNLPPRLTSISPAQGAPGTVVTITGAEFDDRGPQYNTVTIGNGEASGSPTSRPPPAEIISVTPTEIQFKVPDLARTGGIAITSHCLQTATGVVFKVAPLIESLEPRCLGRGDKLEIHGKGFTATGGTVEVKIGGGPWRSVHLPANRGSVKPDIATVYIVEEDTPGHVMVRNTEGLVAASDETLSIAQLQHVGTRIQQEMQGETMIWAKPTLLHLDLESEGCNSHFDEAILYWRTKSGERLRGGVGYAPGADDNSVETGEEETVDWEFSGLDCVAEFATWRARNTPAFPLAEFDGVVVEIKNNTIPVLTVTLPAALFNFFDLGMRLRIKAMAVYKLPWQSTTFMDFCSQMYDTMAACLRILPQPEGITDPSPFHLIDNHFDFSSFAIDSDSGYEDAWSDADDVIDPDYGEVGVLLVEDDLLQPMGVPGVGWFDDAWSTVIAFNHPQRGGEVLAHEIGHTMGRTDDSFNEDTINDHHSLYDEGALHIDPIVHPPCVVTDPTALKTYYQAMLDQRGAVLSLYRIGKGAPVWMNTLWACATGRPKSLMSYAGDMNSDNAFFEPREYSICMGVFALSPRWDFLWLGGGAGAQGALPGGGLAWGEGAAATRSLRLRGYLSPTGAVTITVSYLQECTDCGWPPDPRGEFSLILRDAGRTALAEHPFSVARSSGEGPVLKPRFRLGVPFPDEATSAEIRKGGEILWEKRVSRNAPQVAFTSPAGGAYAPTDPILIRWSASDADGDKLQFALDYSPDGSTWHKLSQYVTAREFEWMPGYAIASKQLRLRIRASDGFLTATAESAPFELLPQPPLAFIAEPRDGAEFTEGRRVDLAGNSMTSSGPGEGRFQWFLDGHEVSVEGRTAECLLETVGEHRIALRVTDHGTSIDEVTVKVLPDYDRDGIPNDWELKYRLNPIDGDNATDDPDQDGVSTFGEFRLGLDPTDADSDDDGVEDGVEISKHANPTDGSSKPLKLPVLRVPAESLILTAEEGDELSNTKSFWVTNSGGGNLSWSADWDADWLVVDPPAGAAPTEVEFLAFPAGMPVGERKAQVTFSAPGATGSPQVCEVTLRVLTRVSPLVVREFIRSDANASGKADISDAVYTLNHLFTGGPAPPCRDAADANDDGKMDISDAVYTLGYLFLGTRAPPAPFPVCGPDSMMPPDLLGCQGFAPCR